MYPTHRNPRQVELHDNPDDLPRRRYPVFIVDKQYVSLTEWLLSPGAVWAAGEGYLHELQSLPNRRLSLETEAVIEHLKTCFVQGLLPQLETDSGNESNVVDPKRPRKGDHQISSSSPNSPPSH